MDINEFSKQYWYLWFFIALLLVLLLLINVGGILWYRKKRDSFKNQESQETSLNEISKNLQKTESIRDSSISKSHLSSSNSILSENSNRSSLINKSTYSSKHLFPNKKSKITPWIVNNQNQFQQITNFSSPSKLKMENQLNSFSLEIFRRQALQEHNKIRAKNQLLPLKLSERLNICAQYWAEKCEKSKEIVSSDANWRFNSIGSSVAEHLITIKSKVLLDGRDFTRMIIDASEQSKEDIHLLNQSCTTVGFGCTGISLENGFCQWIGVAHYFPYQTESSSDIVSLIDHY